MRESKSRNGNKGRLHVFMIAILLAGMWSFPSRAAKDPVGYVAGHPVYENSLLKGLEIDENEAVQSAGEKETGSFPEKYDPRETHKVAAHVEDQGNTNTCWAFASAAAMEGNLIKNGYADETVNLSENHLVYFFYHRQTDPLGGTIDDKNISSLSEWEQNGGTLQGTAHFLTTWAGIKRDSKSAGGLYQAEPLPDVDSYDTDYHVRDVYFYNYSVENVKQAILDHGAVASGIYMDTQYWNFDECAYYCPETAGNHAVAIVGWDDSFSREKFTDGIRPVNDGAWIVRNSYGDSIPELGDGYLYVSYEDSSLDEIIAYEVIETSGDYMHNYQYDGTANPVYSIKGDREWKYANTFVVHRSQGGCNERLEAVSVDLLSTQVRYQVDIYTGIPPSKDPEEGTLSASQSGLLEDAGSQRIILDSPVILVPGERFAVVFSFDCADEDGSVNVAADGSIDGGWIAFESNVEEDQSYIYPSEDGEENWYDTSRLEDEEFNLRINAYTNDTEQKAAFGLNLTTLKLKKGSTEELEAVFTPTELKRNVVWSSSEESVVTVENGVVTAKEPGNATVTATAGTLTASCEVTVYEETEAGTGDHETDESSDQRIEDSKKKEIVMVDVAGRGAKTGDEDGGLLVIYFGMAFCAILYTIIKVVYDCRTKK